MELKRKTLVRLLYVSSIVLTMSACGGDSGSSQDNIVTPAPSAQETQESDAQLSAASDVMADDDSQVSTLTPVETDASVTSPDNMSSVTGGSSDPVVDQQPATPIAGMTDNSISTTSPVLENEPIELNDNEADLADQAPAAPVPPDEPSQEITENSQPAAETGVNTGRMAFLDRLGQPPYASLPVVDQTPRSATIFLPDAASDLANDCLLASFGSIFCYQPSTRLLQAVLSTGEPFWSFNLPGDNSTNRIDGIALTTPTDLTILANITTEFGEPRHELSFFKHTGEFVETRDLFQINGTRWPAINIQGEPLIVEAIAREASFGRAFDLRVIGNFYELVPGGNSATPADWNQSGTFTALLDGETSEYRDLTICEGALISVPSEWPGGAPPCSNVGFSNDLTLNNAPGRLRSHIDLLSSSSLRTVAEQALVVSESVGDLELTTDLPCLQNGIDGMCAMSQVPSIGDRLESSTTQIECPAPGYNEATRMTDTATAQLTQVFARSGENSIELRDELSFSNRCNFNNGFGSSSGNAVVVSTIDLTTGAVIDQETLFDNFTGISGPFWQIADGSYRRSSTSDENISYSLQSSRLVTGGVCDRSCPPSLITSGHYTNAELDITRLSDGGYSYDIAADWTQTLGAPENLSDIPDNIRVDLAFDQAIESSGQGNPLTGFADLRDDEGVSVRMTPAIDINFPDLSVVEYELTQIDGSSDTWLLPIRSFIDGSIRRLQLQ